MEVSHVSLLIAMGIVVTAMATLFLNFGSKFLSIREHETYNTFITRELDIIRSRLDILEQTRPTTGELDARLKTGFHQNNCPPKKL